MRFFAWINFVILVKKNFWTWYFQGWLLPLFSTISEGFINIWCQKNILKNPKVPKTAPKKLVKMVSDFSWTWNFQEWFLTLLSTISEVLKKIYRQKIYQKNFKVVKKAHNFFFIRNQIFYQKSGRVRGLRILIPK